MTIFRDEPLNIREEYLGVDPSRDEPNTDEDLDYSDDDLGENTEITPLGDEMDDDDEVDDLFSEPGEDKDDFLDDEEDVLLDEDLDEDDEIVDLHKMQAINGDDDDDDLFDDDDDELENPDVIPVVPDPDEDDEVWSDDEDDDALLDDEDDDLEDSTGSTTQGLDPNFEIRHPDRQTGRMTGHEPGTAGI